MAYTKVRLLETLCHPPGGNSSPLTEASKRCKINLVTPGKDSAAAAVILAPHSRGYP